MKILLIKSVEDLGTGGDVVDVANGFARNYLIPNRLAVRATRGAIKNAEQYRKKAAANQARILSEAEVLAGKISGFVCTLKASVDENGQQADSAHIDLLKKEGYEVSVDYVKNVRHYTMVLRRNSRDVQRYQENEMIEKMPNSSDWHPNALQSL